jgi:hypothetical protein
MQVTGVPKQGWVRKDFITKRGEILIICLHTKSVALGELRQELLSTPLVEMPLLGKHLV